MASKFDRFRDAVDRLHSDLYGGQSRYDAEFFNYSGGSYDPDLGVITGDTQYSLGTIKVEVIPPQIDTSIDDAGTSFSWDTSIRFPLDSEEPSKWGDNWGFDWGGGTIVDMFVPLGVDSEQPTEVEVNDEKANDVEEYELHGYSIEKGSGLVMCRLREK